MLSREQVYHAAPGIHSGSSGPTGLPIYFYALTWTLLIPLLYQMTDCGPSLLNGANSALATNNGNLMAVHNGFRPQVVVEHLFLLGVLVLGRVEILRAVAKNRFIVLSGPVLAASSALWSGSPGLTLRYATDLMLTTAFACYLSERFSTEHLMRLLIFAASIGAALSVILALFFPNYGIFQRYAGGAWQGIFSHKNAMGLGMASLLTPIFFSKQKMTFRVLYSAALLFLIVMSQSRSAWFVTIGVLAFTAWLHLFRRLRGVESIMLSITAISGVAIVVLFALSHFTAFMTSIGKDPTLTGRTGIYAVVTESILKHPLGGYGYGAFWFGDTLDAKNIAIRLGWPNIGYAENGFLELALNLGFVGVALALFIIGRALSQGVRLLRSPSYTPRVGWFVVLLFMQLLTNIDGGILLWPASTMWIFTLIAAMGLANEVSRVHADCSPKSVPVKAPTGRTVLAQW